MSIKQELQQLKSRLDKNQRKLDGAKTRGDSELVTRFTNDIDDLNKKNQPVEPQTELFVKQRTQSIVEYAFLTRDH